VFLYDEFYLYSLVYLGKTRASLWRKLRVQSTQLQSTQVQAMFRNLISYFIYGVSLFLVVLSIFGSSGVVQLGNLIKDERNLERKEEELRLAVEKSRSELSQIESNPSELERRARNDLGLSRDGEILYVEKR
jgi:cell division protein FtsB